MIVFPHIPKTAGTQLKRALEQVYAPHEYVYDYGDLPVVPSSKINSDPVQWRRDADAFIRGISPDVKMIIGHFSLIKYFDRLQSARLATWVRHPVQRLISNYFYLRSLSSAADPQHPVWTAAVSASFPEFAEVPVMQNLMTRVFLHPARIDDFEFIGVQEHFVPDLYEFAAWMGWPKLSLPVGRANRNPFHGYGAAAEAITSDRGLIRRIERMNRDDLEFYRRAIDLRRKRRWRRIWLLRPVPCAT